ncbi:STAS domain-containing protein [Streptomyces sp. NPDC048639]|uniref:STAS domain-containing protein n=1 Tax=Streptomyces sp. NPDC048639 TaxID=3365581 RepID=UPI00371CAA73
MVVVRGEIDIACEAALQKSLAQTLSCSAQGIEIDLSNVSFWAFSSVRVLLALRQLALREGKSVSLRAISPIVRRVLELSDTLCLFTTRAAPAPPTPPAGRRPPPTALSA